MNNYIGVDLGGTNLRAAVVDTETGAILSQQKSPTMAHKGQASVIERMVKLIDQVSSKCRESGCEIDGIGIGLPGTLDIHEGVIHFLTNLPGQWRSVPLMSIVQERTSLAVSLINDVRALTLSEWIFGAGKGVGNLACFAIGTGIGGGLVLDGKFHLGLGGTAGEFGHQVVEIDGLPCGCGGRGCLELYASGPAIAAMGIKSVMHGHTTRIGELVGYDLNQITTQVVTQAAKEGDRIAIEILERAGVYLGIAVSNVIGVISPQRVIFGGGVAQAGELLLGPVRRTVIERCHVVPVEQIKFVQATLGDNAGLIGAALWARRQHDHPEANRLRSFE